MTTIIIVALVAAAEVPPQVPLPQQVPISAQTKEEIPSIAEVRRRMQDRGMIPDQPKEDQTVGKFRWENWHPDNDEWYSLYKDGVEYGFWSSRTETYHVVISNSHSYASAPSTLPTDPPDLRRLLGRARDRRAAIVNSIRVGYQVLGRESRVGTTVMLNYPAIAPMQVAPAYSQPVYQVPMYVPTPMYAPIPMLMMGSVRTGTTVRRGGGGCAG